MWVRKATPDGVADVQDVEDATAPVRLAHQPALDGLRGCAVALVTLFHGNIGGQPKITSIFPGGFIGVDVFFVLSGFLVTSLLLVDRTNSGRIHLRRFWSRRARRLMPALLVLLVGACAYAVVRSPADELAMMRRTAFAALFYVQNFYQIHRHEETLLFPTWSLAIEEQFYLVFPLALLLLTQFVTTSRRALAAVLSAIALPSFAMCVAVTVHYNANAAWRAYLGPLPRAYQLLTGAVLAVLMLGRSEPPNPRFGRVLEYAGFGALVVIVGMAMTLGARAYWYAGGYMFVTAASLVLIWAAVTPTSTRLRRLLSVRPLVLLGLVSYGVYLFQPLVFTWLSRQHVGFGGPPLWLLWFVVLGGIVWLSYRYVERPIRRGAINSRVMTVVAPVSFLAVAGLILVSTR
jgi:peptidoglycan/LPS O-acetylase OafA/YrhL